MKKLFAFAAAILLALSARAIPAKPGVFTYTQPDGSVVRLERHGDEFFSWTTLAGTTQAVTLDANGFWQKVTITPADHAAARERRLRANRERSALQPRTHTDNAMTHGTRHIPVLLVEFQDVSFQLQNPADKFTAMLNEPGYFAGGGTGSVQDFYLDNSHGLFQPVFDVYGPVTLPHDMAYYGEPVKDASGKITSNDKQPELALYDAAVILNDYVDFSQYDYDDNGKVDMVLFYYAGYNTAEGGSDDAIWPHQWSLQYSSSREARNARFDGKALAAYFCTSELKGNSGVNMCGIGTTCHEFGHSLGLPDFYDTDYEEHGQCSALSHFSIMCSGSYNNEGRTPPYFNAEERIYLGWMTDDDLVELGTGEVSFGSVKDDIAYRTLTDTEGEYFVYECRDGSGWDAPIPAGLLVYHVDKSTVRSVGGITPYEHWVYWNTYNSINAYADHPCFYIVPSAHQKNLQYSGNLEEWVFPGDKNVKTYSPVDWEGNDCGVGLSNIAYEDGQVSFTTRYTLDRTLKGTVNTVSGQPLEGVYVVLSKPAAASQSARLRKAQPRSQVFDAITDANGEFSIKIDNFGADEGHISLSKDGYQTAGMDIKLSKRTTDVQITLRTNSQGEILKYSYWDATAREYMYGDGKTNSLMAAIRIPASEVPEKGATLTSISLEPVWKAQSYYVIVDAGTERLYTVPFTPDGYTGLVDVNLTDLELTVPGGKDLYIGYGIEDADTSQYDGYDGYLFMISEGGNNLYMSSLNLTQSNWGKDSDGYALILDAYLMENKGEGDNPGTGITSFSQMGVAAILDPGLGSYTAGEVFLLEAELPEGASADISWQFDGLTVTDPVTLQAGSHKVTAILTYADGTVETLELMLDVK